MGFHTRQAELEHFRAVEISSRRSVSEVPHPDLCPKLLLHGVEFAIPARGGTVRPVFGPDGITVDAGGDDDWPEAGILLRLARPTVLKACPQCGQTLQAHVAIDPRHTDLLVGLFDLAAKLLRVGYRIDDATMGELLAFPDAAAPRWVSQLLRWCLGMSPDPTPDESAAQMAAVLCASNPAPTPVTRRPWWRPWK